MTNSNLFNSIMLLLFAFLVWLPAAMQTGWESWVATIGFYLCIGVACYPDTSNRGGK